MPTDSTLGAGAGGRGAAPLLAILALTACAYAPSLGGGFVFDDGLQVARNPGLAPEVALHTAFRSHIWAHAMDSTHASNVYRPAFVLWLAGLRGLFGAEDARGYRVASLCLHLGVVALVHALARALGLGRRAAALAALLFALHPQRASSVSWVSGACDPLMAAFGIGGLLLHLRATAREPAPPRHGVAAPPRSAPGAPGRLALRGGSLALFSLALLSKEPALALVGVLAVADGAGPHVPSGTPARARALRALAAALPAVLLVGVYLVARWAALRMVFASTAGPSAGDALLTAPLLLAHYAARFFVPVDLVLGPGPCVVSSALDPRFAAGLAATLALCGASALAARGGEGAGARRVALALAWGPLLPLLDLRHLHPDMVVQDRYLYLPAAGSSLLLAGLCAAAAARLGLTRRQVAVCAAVVAGALAALTAREARLWRTNESLLARSSAVAPGAPTFHLGYGLELYRARRFAEAERAFSQGAALDPAFDPLWRGLGLARLEVGDTAGAAGAAEHVLALDPDDPQALFILARAHLGGGAAERALAPARRLVALRPADGIARALLASIESRLATGAPPGADPPR